jgi:caffeoyl-CoA O-methyltransferase
MFKSLSLLILATLAAAPVALAQQQPTFTRGELKDPVYRLLEELSRPEISLKMWNVPPQDGRLLQILVRLTQARSVLEVGTSDGVSAIWMALGLKDTGGKLITLEIDPGRAGLARENFRKAGLEDRIRLIEGDALKTLPTLKETFNLVFLDAAKEQYKQYLDLIYAQIAPGGVIVAHNAILHAAAMKDYLDYVQDTPDLDTVILKTGEDGVALSYKRK